MTRWQPDARGRLEQAAMNLFSERGFENTTVAEIAGRVGLTERTFFRYFADKREVLFSGAGELKDFLVSRVDDAPDSLPPMDAVLSALLDAATEVFEERRQFAQRRQAIIAANVELQEREQVKLATLAASLADGLRRRGVSDTSASLAAEVGITIFKVAFERWTDEAASDQSLSDWIRTCAAELEVVTSGRRPARRR
jgi:AcrR family transcriptional regulator